MTYEYMTKNGKIRAWLHPRSNKLEFNGITCSIFENEKGKYFQYKGEIIYIDNYIRLSLSDFLTKLKQNEIFDDDFIMIVLNEGIDNLIFEVPMEVKNISMFGIDVYDSNNTVNCECKLDESRYKLLDNYKIDLITNNNITANCRSFYISDLVHLIKYGNIKVRKA